LHAGPNTRATLVENGPARAMVEIKGSMVDESLTAHVDFTLRLTARAASPELEVVLTVRNASLTRWSHAEIGSLAFVVPLMSGEQVRARVATDGVPFQFNLDDDESALLHMAQTTADVEAISSLYYPHLPKVEPGTNKTELIQQGHQVLARGVEWVSFGDQAAYPDAGWVTLWGQQGGATAHFRHMSRQYPAALEGHESGRLSVGFFPEQNPAPFVFVHGQHESRTASLAFFSGNPDFTEDLSGSALDWPLAARAEDYQHYDDAGVFPYDLLTEAEQDLAYQLMGIDHKVFVPNIDLTITRYLYKGTSGGQNNHARIERLLAGEWLRHGKGGQYVTGLDLALYKSEWQVERSDDFVFVAGLPAPENDDIQHTLGTFSDEEHRYREGMVLAYHLTGDMRYAEALFDEAEVLKTIPVWPHERAMVQSLRAQAVVAQFTKDVALLKKLLARLEYVTVPVIDVETASAGFGWEDVPGVGDRRYYANSADLQNEKPPGENFISRGFVSASLAPLGYHWTAHVLSPNLAGKLAGKRVLDLAWWTRNELFPYHPDPAQRRLVYSYAISLKEVVGYELYDFHPILFAMSRGFLATGETEYLQRGVEQIEAFAVHDSGPYSDNLFLLDSRLDCQDFFSTWLAWRLAGSP